MPKTMYLLFLLGILTAPGCASAPRLPWLAQKPAPNFDLGRPTPPSQLAQPFDVPMPVPGDDQIDLVALEAARAARAQRASARMAPSRSSGAS